MLFITATTWQKNGVEVLHFNEIKWLNEKLIEKQLEHSNLREITSKYPEYLWKKRFGLQECDNPPCRIFLRKDFAIQIIIGNKNAREGKDRK